MMNQSDYESGWNLEKCFSVEVRKMMCESASFSVPCPFPNLKNVNELGEFSKKEIEKISVTCLIFVVSLFGNFMILLITNSRSTNRTAMDIFLVNLSIADILITVFCLIDNMLSSLSYNYQLGPIGCQAGSFIHMICLFVSVLTLVGIAVDRVYAVLFPLQKLQISNRLRLLLVGAIWLISAIFASPFLFLKEYVTIEWENYVEYHCNYSRGMRIFNETKGRCTPTFDYAQLYHIMVAVFLYFIPTIILLIAYSLIINRLWRSPMIGELTAESNTRVRINKKQVVRLALLVLSAFLICWTPLQILIIRSSIDTLVGDQQIQNTEKVNSRNEFWIYLLAYSNSAINPIIYGGFKKECRNDFLVLFRRNTKSAISFSNGECRRTMSSYAFVSRPNAINKNRDTNNKVKNNLECFSKSGSCLQENLLMNDKHTDEIYMEVAVNSIHE